MARPEWETINTRRAARVPALVDRLAKLLRAEKGVPVARADAVAIAVREALESRGVTGRGGRGK